LEEKATIDFRLYVITDRRRCEPRTLESVLEEACAAGVRAIQLREKDIHERDVPDVVGRIRGIVRPRGARLLLNYHRSFPDVPPVDGFHFPDGIPVPTGLRRQFPTALIGVSTHASASAAAAASSGADFVTFGPVYETPSKIAYGPPQGLDALAKAVAASTIPVFAVGGVTPERAADCITAGAHGVAVIGAVMAAADVTEAVDAFKEALGEL
jgi:thiamine-phosphate pyrophosphorylase